MNFKQIVKQTERKQKAINAVKKQVRKEKISILKAFLKPVLDYLEYIHNSADYRFSSEPYYDNKTKPLLIQFGNTSPIARHRIDIENGINSEIMTTELSFASGSASIGFRISDDFVPSVYYRFGKSEYVFTSQEEFIEAFTELLIKYRK